MSRLVFLTLVVLAVGLAAESTQATAPGKNGKIAFRRYLRPNERRGVIFAINSDGTSERRVTHPVGAEDDQPDWSPDGSRIVFRRERGPDGAIYSVRANGSGLKRVSGACCEEDYTPTFSPDAQQVAFASLDEKHWTIVVIASDGQKNRRVVVTARSPARLLDPQFSPDGKRLIFVQQNLGRTKPKGGYAVFVVSADGSGLSQITPWKLVGGDNPDWSPNGKWVLFRSNVDLDTKQSQIYVIHPNGTALKQLTHFKKRTIVTSSSFSPDGKRIVLGASGIGGNADLYVMRSNGSGRHPITRTKLWDSAPDWGPAR